MHFDLILLIAALVCFLGASIVERLGRTHLGWLGLALLTLAMIV